MKERRHGGLKYLLLLFIPAAAGLVYFASRNASFAEWYATNLYKWLSLGVNFVTSLLPFSVAEILILLFALWVCIYIVKFVIKLIRGRSPRGRTVVRFFVNPVLLAGVLLFVFVMNAGINYYRQPFAEAAGLNVTKYSEQELADLCYYLASQANELRSGLKEDKDGVMKLSGTLEQTAQKAKDAYDKMQDKYPTLTKGYGKTKQLYLSHYLSYTKTTGFFFPFTMEANINGDVSGYTIPSTMCHELSHLRGYMREDEANFISYLVCIQSGDRELQYSGVMLAFVHAGNALSAQNRAAYTEVFRTLNEEVQRDIRSNNAYWAQFEGPVAQAASTINDTYLKVNSQKEGIKSYGRMTDLLLAYYQDTKAGN